MEVNEYLGAYPKCTTDVGAPYATTRYEMEVLGKLTRVTDALGSNTTTFLYSVSYPARPMAPQRSISFRGGERIASRITGGALRCLRSDAWCVSVRSGLASEEI